MNVRLWVLQILLLGKKLLATLAPVRINCRRQVSA